MTLILGGARSGKSTYGEQLATAHGGRITYLATCQPYDDEMVARIAKHRAERPDTWRTVECPYDPAAAIRAHAADSDCFLLDCLTLLVSNLVIMEEATAEERVQAAIDDLVRACGETNTPLIMVSNEVGLGLVPEYPLGRLYRDILGRANQRLAAVADPVWFLIAGLPINVKALAKVTHFPEEGKL
jgi:adenosylcobinamide kinase/adenosylcobinamide-phosphate guanylyltransferase